MPTVRRQLIELLSHEPRSASWLARELGLHRGDIDEQLRHALRSAAAAGHRVARGHAKAGATATPGTPKVFQQQTLVEVIPARCKDCNFEFSADRLNKPGRCPSCRGSRIFEPLIRLAE
jgi:predicted Zn-ribbon and HTH transcriptional regulator